MQIGEAAAASGVSAKMIRHYESVGLIDPADRSAGNYRTYAEDDVRRLRFIRRARDLGFPVSRIRALLALWTNRKRSSAEVRSVAQTHLTELEGKIADLRAMADALRELVEACGGDARPHCAIIDRLAGATSATPPDRS